jgi:WD40 repeat protein
MHRISPATSPPERKYAVFISYRHADNKEQGRQWANWLHHTLETYEIPPDLVGRTNLRGEPVPASLYPVFRDEEELPADADLSANIQRALENSALLVVLCSPRAVESRFVADEIRIFKQLGKTGYILALMIDGEPNATDDPGKTRVGIRPEQECLPEPLRHGVACEDGCIDWTQRTEPIAADVRPENKPVQGWTTTSAYREELTRQGLAKPEIDSLTTAYEDQLQLASMKIIAGALGLPLGEVTQRDKAYQLIRERKRIVRLRILASSFATLGAIALGASVIAWHQKNEADSQKVIALCQTQAAQYQEGLAVSAGKLEKEQRNLAESKQLEAQEQTEIATNAQFKAEQASLLLKRQLSEASRADHAAAEIRFRENRWHEGLAYLGRSLVYDPTNSAATRHLWTTLRYSNGLVGNTMLSMTKFDFGSLRLADYRRSIQFSPDGDLFYTNRVFDGLRADGVIKIWQADGTALGVEIEEESLIVSTWKSDSKTLRIVRRQYDKQKQENRYFLRDVSVLQPKAERIEQELRLGDAAEWAFDPKGICLVCIGAKRAVVWNCDTHREVCYFASDWMDPRVSFSQNGNFLVCNGSENEVALFTLPDGKQLGVRLKLPDVSQSWRSLVSSDGLACVSFQPHHFCIHDVRTGKLLKHTKLPISNYKDVVITGDGMHVICTIESPRHAVIYAKSKNWDEIARTPNFDLPPKAATLTVTYDGKYFATSTEPEFEDKSRDLPEVQVWETRSGKLVTPGMPHPSGVRAVQFNPAGLRLVTAGNDGVVRTWEIEGQGAAPIVMPHPPLRWGGSGEGATVKFVNRGNKILGYSKVNQKSRLWDAKTGTLLADSSEATPLGRCVEDASGEWLVSLWSKPLPIEYIKEKGAMAPRPTQVGFLNPALMSLWNAETGRMVGSPVKLSSSEIGCNCEIDTTQQIIFCSDEALRRWSIPDLKELPTIHSKAILAALMPRRNCFVRTPWSATSSETAEIVNADNGVVLASLKTSNPPITFTHASFNHDGTRLFTWGTAKDNDPKRGRGELVQLWDTKDWSPLGRPQGAYWQIANHQGSSVLAGLIQPTTDKPEIFVRILASEKAAILGDPLPCNLRQMALSRDGHSLVTAWSEDAREWFRVWETSTGKAVTPAVEFKMRAQNLLSFALSDDHQWIAYINGSQIQIWSALTGEVASIPFGVDARIAEPKQRIDNHYFGDDYDSAAFSPTADRLVAANDFGVVVWNIKPPDGPLPVWLPEFLQSVSGYSFDEAGRLYPVQTDRRNEIKKRLSELAGPVGWEQLLGISL